MVTFGVNCQCCGAGRRPVDRWRDGWRRCWMDMTQSIWTDRHPPVHIYTVQRCSVTSGYTRLTRATHIWGEVCMYILCVSTSEADLPVLSPLIPPTFPHLLFALLRPTPLYLVTCIDIAFVSHIWLKRTRIKYLSFGEKWSDSSV